MSSPILSGLILTISIRGACGLSGFGSAIAAFIARHADILSVPSAAAFEDPWRTPGKPCGWLLVPATTWLIAALAKGDEVVTGGGLVGKIAKVGENYVTLEIAEGTEVVVQKPAIGLVLPKGTLKSL